MATSPISLLFTCLVITIFTTTAHPSTPKHTRKATDFIRSSCRATRYPALCYHSLSGFADKIHHNEHRLALTALAVSLSRTKSVGHYVSQMSRAKGIKHRQVQAVKDCFDTMSDSVDQLSRSFKELGHMGHIDNSEDFMWHMSNVQTWVSAALTDANTCMDGLSGNVMTGELKGAINMRLNNVAQVTSNALALVNRFAARH